MQGHEPEPEPIDEQFLFERYAPVALRHERPAECFVDQIRLVHRAMWFFEIARPKVHGLFQALLAGATRTKELAPAAGVPERTFRDQNIRRSALGELRDFVASQMQAESEWPRFANGEGAFTTSGDPAIPPRADCTPALEAFGIEPPDPEPEVWRPYEPDSYNPASSITDTLGRILDHDQAIYEKAFYERHRYLVEKFGGMLFEEPPNWRTSNDVDKYDDPGDYAWDDTDENPESREGGGDSLT